MPGPTIPGPERDPMNSLLAASIAMACLSGGILLGATIRRHLPDHHLHDDSRDVLKLASAMIGTLVALVIGLLVGSSKSSFDQANAGVVQIGAKVILLDGVLKRYGPETAAIRREMSRGLAASIEHLWPSASGARPDITAVEHASHMEDARELIARLDPPDEPRRVLRTQALAISNDLVQYRWLMIEQAQATLPTAFLGVLIFWLTVLFASLGLLAPWNATTVCSLLVCAFSMSVAIYLILEMNRPLEGAIHVSPAPLRKAIAVIGT